ncbi:MAG TPA: 3-hydroxybutyryl-CoA dehydrogenase [Firmicutes bacterium]|jgi:3-hydroxybutyryl-CoA dehydrogenase|nr:3-hydroxybutyryl-CoA dehydrogenase [Candidatus Fermentithermobacillaceae bacterium]
MDMALSIGVIGAGTMGRGIAETALVSGFSVILLDTSPEIAARGVAGLKKSLERGVERGRITRESMDDMLGRLTPGTDLSLLKDCSVVLEAVYEDPDVKSSVLTTVSQIAGSETLIGTNTSSLSISRLARKVASPERFVGIHFFNPVPVMKLVEIIPGENTSSSTVSRARELALAMGKTPVVVKECPGFVVNRLLCPLMNEAAYLFMEGVASAEDIDTAMKLGANHPIGPLALADLVGIDVLLAIMEVLHSEMGDDKYKPCPLLKEMVAKGHLGRKTGQGFYSYGP